MSKNKTQPHLWGGYFSQLSPVSSFHPPVLRYRCDLMTASGSSNDEPFFI